MTFGQKLKMTRKRKGFSSQESLGLALGVSTHAVRMYECDEYRPRFVVINKMCRVFNMTYDELMEGVEI